MVVYLVSYYSEGKQAMHAVEAHNTHAQLLTLGATANMYVQRRGGGGSGHWSLYCLNHFWHVTGIASEVPL